jgi:molybdopterin converting factor small subunit
VATVSLPAPLRRYAGDRANHDVEAATVLEALAEMERRHPGLAGYVLDERGSLRRHLSVFVNGVQERPDASVAAQDEVLVLTSISGGSGEAGLLVGTKKGLLVMRGPRDGRLAVAARAFAGLPVEYAMRDPRTGRSFAAVTDPWFGPRVHVADDPLGEWTATSGPAFPEDTGATVKRVWVIQPGERPGELWAGVDPAALFRSRDGGETWELVRALWDVPTRERWQGGAGGLCLHSICPWPGEPDRLLVGISAAGIWITEDGGESWAQGVTGLTAPYLPEDVVPTFEFCIHHVERAPDPARLYMQFHGGVYRSDDAGSSWGDIAPGLPSSFGFPIVADPRDGDRAWVIPLSADRDRVPPDCRLQVWATEDGGGSWRPAPVVGRGADAYVTVLRQAFCHDGGEPLGLYFGASSGELFASADAGATWRTAADRLPPVYSVRAG